MEDTTTLARNERPISEESTMFMLIHKKHCNPCNFSNFEFINRYLHATFSLPKTDYKSICIRVLDESP